MFYERSQSLVGICKDVGTNSSRTMTLELTQYDKAVDKKGKKRERTRAVSEGGAPQQEQEEEESSPKRQATAPASPGSVATT